MYSKNKVTKLHNFTAESCYKSNLSVMAAVSRAARQLARPLFSDKNGGRKVDPKGKEKRFH